MADHIDQRDRDRGSDICDLRDDWYAVHHSVA